LNYSKNLIPEISTTGVFTRKLSRLGPHAAWPRTGIARLTGFVFVRGILPEARVNSLPGRKSSPFVTVKMAPFLLSWARSKTFRVESNSYNWPNQIAIRFQSLRNGGVLALTETRRSGAQRGASENNFGQRFSVSTPCFSLVSDGPPPPSFLYRQRYRSASNPYISFYFSNS
jgi:hypothetical protein